MTFGILSETYFKFMHMCIQLEYKVYLLLSVTISKMFVIVLGSINPN